MLQTNSSDYLHELEFFKYALDQSATVSITDIDGKMIYVNDKFCEITGFYREELIGQNHRILNSGYHSKQFFKTLWDTLLSGKIFHNEVRDKHKNGNFIWFDTSIIPYIGQDGKPFRFMTIRYDITERINAIKIKELFLANMGHELRTPVHAITNLVDFLLQTKIDSEQFQYLRAAKESSSLLLKLINDLLDISKIEEGKLIIEKADFSIHEVLDSIRIQFKERVKEKNLEFKITIDPAVPPVLIGDSFRLQQILVNLINNAIKFTDTGTIALSLKLKEILGENYHILFSVSDTGKGIAPENQKDIFSKFTQVNSKDATEKGGTGLGLSIVKQLVELQEGSISVDSELGKGTQISFHLPYKIGNIATIKKLEKNKETPINTGRSLHVLIADDSNINRMVATKHMKQFGFTSELAENGLEAFEKLQKSHFDIILMDIQMPVLDGFETTKRIRKELLEPLCHIPIIAVTACYTKEFATQCVENEINDYISKPYNLRLLHNKITSLTSGEKRFHEHQPKSENKNVEDSSLMFDLTYLEEMAGGDSAFLKDMISHFIESTPEMISDLEDAFNKNDLDRLRQIAHKFSPQLSFLGVKSIIENTSTIETIAFEKTNLDQLKPLIEKVVEVSLKAVEQLKIELKNINI